MNGLSCRLQFDEIWSLSAKSNDILALMMIRRGATYALLFSGLVWYDRRSAGMTTLFRKLRCGFARPPAKDQDG